MGSTNPFSVLYLTEAALTPDDLLARYSFLPFRHVGDQVARPTNVFLVGRKGVGKTMLLKMFDPEIMARLFSRPPTEQWILDLIPPATLGIYFNLGSPAARVNLFQGGTQSVEWWLRAYGDYLNALLLDQALGALDRMCTVQRWCEVSGAATNTPSSADVFQTLLRILSAESSQYDGLATIDELRAHLQSRAQGWTRYVNMDPSSSRPPQSLIPFGATLFALVRAIRESGMFSQPFRLFVLVDQYEFLYQHRRKVDFRPVFNEGMYLASRGGAGVEFKIGTRQYAYKEFRLANSEVQVEMNREIIEVDVDHLARAFYTTFAVDVLRKRLAAVSSNRTAPSVIHVRALLPAFTPQEEAQRYLSYDSGDQTKHLRPFSRRWERLGIPEEDSTAVFQTSAVRDANPLVSTLACIAVTRWIRDGENGAPLSHGPVVASNDRTARISAYLDRLVQAISQRYSIGGAESRRQRLRAIDDFVHDAEEAALFQIASAYKNQRKYYSGLSTIIKLSSNVALVLIEILREAYDYLLMSDREPFRQPISPELQSAAIYTVSEALFRQIPHDCDYGETLQGFVAQLGACLRELQLELTVPQPSPNGFSIDASELNVGPGVVPADPRSNASTLIREAVSWGLLEEREHQSKQRGAPKRRKYHLNRAYCPYFGISEVWRKDPIYVDHLETFVDAMRDKQTPQAIRRALKRAQGVARQDCESASLFSPQE